MEVIVLLLEIAGAVGTRLLLTYQIARLRLPSTGRDVGTWTSILWLNLLCEILLAGIIFFNSQ